MKRLLALLLSLMSSAALAQTTGALDPSPAPAKPSVSEDVPPGGCMPIGLTAAGEIVFPIQCRALIERARGNAVEQKPAAAGGKSATVEEKPAALEQKPAAVEEKPAAAEQKPAAVEAKPTIGEARPGTVEEKPAAAEEKPAAAEEKTAAKQSDDVAPEDSKPANQSLETVPLPKHGERRQRTASGESCTRYRTYDAASGTYRGFDGRTRPCGQAQVKR
ncbi:MAG TPA: BA14K family protein [Verrucomicrobiae bacterium]|nr:BA14K family protein [Verrucomicrobiae bacterium]